MYKIAFVFNFRNNNHVKVKNAEYYVIKKKSVTSAAVVSEVVKLVIPRKLSKKNFLSNNLQVQSQFVWKNI